KITQDNIAAYTFIIKGWNGTRTVLKDQTLYGNELVAKESVTGDPNILGDLSETEFKEFWVKIDKTVDGQTVLQLGQDDNIIINYTDPDPASKGLNNIKYVGVSNWNIPTEYRDIKVTSCSSVAPLSCAPTWNDAWHFTKPDQATIKFKAKALHDVIVMLSPDKSSLADFPAYTFVISGWAEQTGIGTRTILRTVNGNNGGFELGQITYFIDAQDGNKFLPYWITINKIDGGKTVIKLGQSETVNKNVILSCIDPNPAANNLTNISYFGLSSWNVPVEYKEISIEKAPENTKENLEQAGFRQVQGALTQIALGSAPEIWGVNIENRVFRWSGSEWFQPKPDAILRQLTIGQYGCIWASGSDNSIWQLERSTNNWYRVDGLAKKVVLDNYNMAWVIGQDNCLYRATNNTSCHPNWKKVSNANLTDIAVKDSTDIYALNNEKVNNGYRFYVNNKDLSNNVKAVIIPGDFTTGGDANSVNRFINDWEQPLNQALKYTDGKLYVGPGNHDNDSVVWYRYTDAFNYLSDKYGDWFYSFDIEGVHFCCVGGYPSNWGIRLPSFPFVAGLYWLNGDLAQIDASAPVVIFFHYPVVGDYSDWWSKSEKDGFYNIIKNYNVKLIITGHTHASYASIWRDRFPVANVSGTSCLACKYNPATQDFNKTFIDIYNGPVSWDAMYQSLPELNPA
ncbi:MAG: tectonin domain-containing protein, partial [Candidatus Babeliales bacterium]